MSDQPSTRTHTAAERLLIELREWDPDQPETMIRELTAEIEVEAHHHRGYDLEHRLDVLWLCRPHHEEAHHGAA